MPTQEPKIPGPDHPITIEPTGVRVVARVGTHVVADTTRALTLREANYPPVQYIPLDDVDQTLLMDSAAQTYCPYKGDASYYSIALAEGGPPMRCGPTASRTTLSQPSPATSPSTPTGWMSSSGPDSRGRRLRASSAWPALPSPRPARRAENDRSERTLVPGQAEGAGRDLAGAACSAERGGAADSAAAVA